MVFKSQVNPAFRSQLSETIFRNKYAHQGAESWDALVHTLVEDVTGPLETGGPFLSKEERDELKRLMRQMKFIPGGRYLYYAGRPVKFYNNCLTGDTQLYTEDGLRRMDSFSEGEKLKVLSPIEGEYLDATMHYHGKRPIWKITFQTIRGRGKKTWTVRATPDHHWPLKNGGDTYSLKVGDVVPAAGAQSYNWFDQAIAHGMIYADGSSLGTNAAGSLHRHQLRLCGKKEEFKHYVEEGFDTEATYPPFANGDPMLYVKSYYNLKDLPSVEDFDVDYVANFIYGWALLDGHWGSSCLQIHSVDEAAIDYFIKYAPLAGLVVTGEKKVETKDSNFGPRKPLYRVNFAIAEHFSGFKVVSIEPDGEEDVWCPFEPVHNRIVLEHGIDTFQCYLLKAEEDTREDWANVSWRSESCLLTGGGIGVDYSVYRPEGAIIRRTGGGASGPLPKMEMINEIGRRVMQGGSRRSAIYASLNWQHGDIRGFLRSKDWASKPVGTTGFTYADVKQQDFNFPCPLDQTNISTNYDTQWLLNYYKSGGPGDVFLENVSQALKTGEPGFSFNFFEKENETLRNACTEVTSEDDSDVCNLGSVNLSRIDSIAELATVVELGTKFLLYGTLRAELPFEKVHQTRQKNRRLGLGFMGVHEWLLKRGYRYEVVPELHQWLSVYKGVSDDVSRRTADQLGISRPVANRAIAPTGTIGMLAGTTTGIEPVYAVAYKRRYLVGHDRWKYQYAVDSVAQDLINLGISPDKIESATDLAEDYERRIKFQADVQDYVDMSISSTINLPHWGSKLNNPDTIKPFARVLASYAPRLRGFTCYPDGARGGQPLTSVPYLEAVNKLGQEFEEHIEGNDVCDLRGGGSCGV